MTSLAVTIPLALVMGLFSLGVFFWALKSDQFADLDGAANRILIDEEGESLPEPGEHR
ncbi:MAG: cbb3-type cytochrome oxidase assembly protein CcoS [Novosphingobium sp.]